MKLSIVFILCFLFGYGNTIEYSHENPSSVFTIDFIKNNEKTIYGKFCYVTRDGARIDCDNSFKGVKRNNKIYFDFNSSFGGKNGRAMIKFISEKQILWKLLKKPIGEFYVPKRMILSLNDSSPKKNAQLELKFNSDRKITKIKTDSENKKAFLTKKLNISKKLESISDLKSILKSIKKKSEITLADIPTIQELLFFNPLSIKTLTTYNNIAYYLQKAGANKEAAYLLEKIIEKFPNRTVAYYNLGDAYWALGKKQKAIKAYTTYIEQMCHKGLQKKIPKVVLERVSNKK